MQADFKRVHNDSEDEDFAGFDESTLEEPAKVLKRMKKYTPGDSVKRRSLKSEKTDVSQLSTGTDKQDYKKPFTYGWRRELVYRATPETSKDKGDVYYITPFGRKLRTKADIIAHLKDDLSIDNFSFLKEPIGGLNDGDEIIRMAKPLGKTTQKISNPNNSSSVKRIAKPKQDKEIKKQGTPISVDLPLQATTGSIRLEKLTKDKAVELLDNHNKEVCDNTANLTIFEDIKQDDGDLTKHKEKEFMANYFRNVSMGSEILLQTFQYLKIQEISRASCVCRMWNMVANYPLLWRTVRMKNSHINDWKGFAKTLKRNGTMHLDLRKSLLISRHAVSGDNEEIWKSFSESIKTVENLEKIDMCRCPSSAIESLLKTNYNLKVLNALAIRSEEISLDDVGNLQALEELRLKSIKFTLEADISGLHNFNNLKHLSLTTVSKFMNNSLYILASLVSLKTLELGECTDLPSDFPARVLMKLENLQRLRLEKGQNSFPMFDVLNAISNLKQLEQLELINCDVKIGFDEHIAQCTNLQKILLIPTYVSQSAATNYMIIKGIKSLHDTLNDFIWAVTVELLRVTELYIDQCDKDNRSENISNGGDSIPILKPVSSDNADTVEICPLTEVHEILSKSCPKTSIKILKTPVQNTWKLTLSCH